jgi:hypothetical protein
VVEEDGARHRASAVGRPARRGERLPPVAPRTALRGRARRRRAGHEIPARSFDFVRRVDWSVLEPVLHHNRLDRRRDLERAHSLAQRARAAELTRSDLDHLERRLTG